MSTVRWLICAQVSWAVLARAQRAHAVEKGEEQIAETRDRQAVMTRAKALAFRGGTPRTSSAAVVSTTALAFAALVVEHADDDTYVIQYARRRILPLRRA